MGRRGVWWRNSLNITSCSARLTATSGLALSIAPQIRSYPDSALRTTSSIQSGAAYASLSTNARMSPRAAATPPARARAASARSGNWIARASGNTLVATAQVSSSPECTRITSNR